MTDVRQSPQFAEYMKLLGWRVEKFSDANVFLRRFPLVGHFAKLSKSSKQFQFNEFRNFRQEYKIYRMKVAPNITNTHKRYEQIREDYLTHNFSPDNDPYTPTHTIQFDLTQSEDHVFNNFSEAKRRAVRRALKNNIVVRETDDIDAFVKIRQHQYAPLGFLVNGETKHLWETFAPKHATLLLAYEEAHTKPVAGVFLVFYNSVAYYWFATALPQGKKLFTPTLLVWEALKLSQQRGCKLFDFEGIYDERFPEAGKSWKGFTKFKEGFGGNHVISMENFIWKKSFF